MGVGIDTVGPIVNKEETEAEYTLRRNSGSPTTQLVLWLRLYFSVGETAPVTNHVAFPGLE